jgi:transketolase
LVSEHERFSELGQQLRVDSVRAAAAAASGHPTSSMSAADLMAVLLAKYLRYDFDRPAEPLNDHLIFSKGHASPLLYSLYKAAGAISDEELLSFRKLGSRLQGHPTPQIPWVDVATGSLGQGLPCAVGVALAGKRLDRVPYRVWVLCGDSEMAEGSIWEAFDHASHERLDNLIAIIDVNRLGQRGETMLGWDTAAYVRRAQAFGWRALEIDGHDVQEIDHAYEQALAGDGQPVAIIGRTVKGKGVSAVENRNGFHGKPLEDPEAAIAELGGLRELTVRASVPADGAQPHRFTTGQAHAASWKVGEEVATRRGFGEALTALAASDGRIVALDGEVGNSTYTELFADAHPERYF